MAGNFFYRQSKIKQSQIETNSRIRNNAFVTVSSGDFKLPIDGTSWKSTYNPNGTGRAAPILKDVKISLLGEAASLRKAELSFVCFDRTSFEKAEEALLTPGSEITIKYGYVGPEKPSDFGEYEFRVYDYSFKITKQNYFECSLKAFAKGQSGAFFDKLDINGQQSFPAETFVTDYDLGNETSEVKNIFDYIDYRVQLETGEIEDSDFDPDNGTCGEIGDGIDGYFGVLEAPDDYDPPTKLPNGWFTGGPRIIYVTLGGIVSMVNRYILTDNENNYQIEFDKNYSDIKYDCKTLGKIWSPSPFLLLFPYKKGSPENNYSETDDGINCDAFAEEDGDIYDNFRIDNQSSYNRSGAEGILVSRDLLRDIQREFDEKALKEDDSTEETEKAKSKLNLSEFFRKIFASIRDNSGGDWDFTLEVDESKPAGTISIVNKNAPGKDPVKALILRPTIGKNGIREMSLSSAVPSDVQAEAFGGAPSLNKNKTAADIIAENKVALIEAEVKYENQKAELITKLDPGQKDIHKKSYAQDSITAAKGLIKSMVNTLTPEEFAKENKLLAPIPYPLTLELTIDGIEGFNFGDTITSDYLPARYTKNSGMRIVFTVTEYTHTISGNDWKTQLKTVSRIVGD